MDQYRWTLSGCFHHETYTIAPDGAHGRARVGMRRLLRPRRRRQGRPRPLWNQAKSECEPGVWFFIPTLVGLRMKAR
jgi:hypothetical protein